MAPVVQLLSAVVILTLTFLVAFAGIQVFHILHEVRLSIRKFNRILDHTQSLSETAARPITAVNSFFSEVKDLVSQTQDNLIESTPDRVITTPSIHTSSAKSHSHRFFRRSGATLKAS